MKKKRLLTPTRLAIIVVVLGLAAYSGSGIAFLNIMELRTIDLRFKSRGPIEPASDVVLAVIDERSIDAEGKWVWPRSKIARLIDRLSDAGASVVAFDIGFLEPGSPRELAMLKELADTIHPEMPGAGPLMDRIQRWQIRADDDGQLIHAIEQSKSEIVLGHFFHMDDTASPQPNDTTKLTIRKNAIKSSRYKMTRFLSSGSEAYPLIEAARPQPNIPAVAGAAPYSGFFNMDPDPDGVVRWMLGVIAYEDVHYAPLSLMALAAHLDTPLALSIDGQAGVQGIELGDRFIPTDEKGRILVNYHGPSKTHPHISVTDILNDRVPKEQLAGKILLVGATAVGIYDLRVTPFGSVFPGLEIHANVISSILNRDYVQNPQRGQVFALLAIVLLGLLPSVIMGRFGAVSGGLTTGGLGLAYVGISQFLFVSHGLVMNLVYPMCTLLASYIGVTVYHYLVESRQKRFIRQAFATYLAPSVVSQLIDDPDALNLGGEEREITAFFSDVQGFSRISESLSPPVLVELLNDFLTEMTDIILKHKGTVDKFEGDAIIAFFGAPHTLPEHSAVACQACCEMQTRLGELRQKWRSDNLPELHMRIGMCTGPAVVGNMGSRNRMDYTMMGDTVNIAARLEGCNKIYGIYALISDTTRNAAGDAIVAREIDAIQVVGRETPVRVYQPMGTPESVTDTTLELIRHYETGLEAYRNQQWDEAIDAFDAAQTIEIDDPPSRVMAARCRAFKEEPPTTGWSGAFTMTTK